MNCSLDKVAGLISGAIAALLAAIGLAHFWVAAIPLFAAAALVATVAYYFIPAIKSALLDYAACRGPSDKCSISMGVSTLGQAAATLSVVSFSVAAAMEVAALGFLFSWFLAWLGVALQVAVAALVLSGTFSCAIVILILLGVLTNANSFKNCMDSQNPDVPPTKPPVIG
jgi:hypothetical protein